MDGPSSNLPRLRKVCGLTQRELADLVSRSIHTIRAIEQGKLALSQELAIEISKATGVLVDWLFHPSEKMPPVDQLASDLTREGFEAHRASVLANKKTHDSYEGLAEGVASKLFYILREAEKRPNFDLALYRVEKFLDQMEEEFLAPAKKPKSAESKKEEPETEELAQSIVTKPEALTFEGLVQAFQSKIATKIETVEELMKAVLAHTELPPTREELLRSIKGTEAGDYRRTGADPPSQDGNQSGDRRTIGAGLPGSW